MSEKTIKFYILFNNCEITKENLSNWFKEMVYFKPAKMYGTTLTNKKTRKFNAKKFFDNIEKELEYSNNNFSIELEGENSENLFWLCHRDVNSYITCFLCHDIYVQVKGKLLELMNTFFQKHHCIVAYVCSADDDFWQNLKNIEYYKREEKFSDSLHLIPDPRFPSDQIVDIEYNSGHSHYTRELWFGSCWAMWFGEEYFQYIPKETLASFKDYYENKQLPDGSIRILLHGDIWDYDKPENRERQWAFRRHAGVDEVAHRLQNEPWIVENTNPHMEMCSGNFEHGGVQLIKMYCDSKGRNLPKSQATECRVREIDEQGKVVWSETQKLQP